MWNDAVSEISEQKTEPRRTREMTLGKFLFPLLFHEFLSVFFLLLDFMPMSTAFRSIWRRCWINFIAHFGNAAQFLGIDNEAIDVFDVSIRAIRNLHSHANEIIDRQMIFECRKIHLCENRFCLFVLSLPLSLADDDLINVKHWSMTR